MEILSIKKEGEDIMELKWSLKELYKSFESNEFESDLEKVDNLIGKINDWALEIVKSTEEPVRKLEEYINLYTELHDTVHGHE